MQVVLLQLPLIKDEAQVKTLVKKLGPPLVTLLSEEAEIQYVALRNINLIVQNHPEVLSYEIKVRFPLSLDTTALLLTCLTYMGWERFPAVDNHSTFNSWRNVADCRQMCPDPAARRLSLPEVATSSKNGGLQVFFCKYNDPIYVKLEKLDIMIALASERNIDQVLLELKEYATEVDVDFVRKVSPARLTAAALAPHAVI